MMQHRPSGCRGGDPVPDPGQIPPPRGGASHGPASAHLDRDREKAAGWARPGAASGDPESATPGLGGTPGTRRPEWKEGDWPRGRGGGRLPANPELRIARPPPLSYPPLATPTRHAPIPPPLPHLGSRPHPHHLLSFDAALGRWPLSPLLPSLPGPQHAPPTPTLSPPPAPGPQPKPRIQGCANTVPNVPVLFYLGKSLLCGSVINKY